MTSSLDEVLAAVSRERVVDMARSLCRVALVEGREGPRADVVADWLRHRRIDVHVDPVLPGRPNVIARLRGRGTGPDLLLNGHLDASRAPNWTRDPHDPWITEGRLYGAGISDMLGGLAAMMEAMRAAAELDPLPGDLTLLANMHHDSNGLGTKYALATGDDWPRFGINGEPTSLTLMTAHGGCVKFELVIRGRGAHVSRMEEGADALAAAADVYQAVRRLRFTHEPCPRLPPLPRCVVGICQAGEAPANVPDSAVLRGDIRTVPGMSWSTVRADLERVIAETCPSDVQAEVRCLVRQRAFLGPTAGPLVDAITKAHRMVRGDALRIDVDHGSQCFVTDAVDMAAFGIESIVYGPAIWHHAPDAFVEIDEMADAARVYVATALQLMDVMDGKRRGGG